MSSAYRGEGKTDAKDALVIADQARMRRDFDTLSTPREIVCTLQLLTNHRDDLIADRVRLINRLRDLLVGVCPALERAFGTTPGRGARHPPDGMPTSTCLSTRQTGCSRTNGGPTPFCAGQSANRQRRGSASGPLSAFNTEQYKARNVGERWFSRLKQFQAVATRFDTLAARYVAGLRLASLILWLREP